MGLLPAPLSLMNTSLLFLTPCLQKRLQQSKSVCFYLSAINGFLASWLLDIGLSDAKSEKNLHSGDVSVSLLNSAQQERLPGFLAIVMPHSVKNDKRLLLDALILYFNVVLHRNHEFCGLSLPFPNKATRVLVICHKDVQSM
ncbi:uncharacterized protein BDW43DRAFT_184961 [Aspergillus alliaceus]|uniref:uncharacterized protein n=1 Tax=Petromyces alliaceus TaxID=209559 RepID=UPI0012A3FB18|nr:uncharacterized protein BDW43DRAFT_184961 [Aspergillus alliaceus]KAB8237842.1 hypothetical protein BDW43DRAFT_184961 [Aspergillus alliaceus]